MDQSRWLIFEISRMISSSKREHHRLEHDPGKAGLKN
jgi:hypothetical protein